jgi:hypothetical protein
LPSGSFTILWWEIHRALAVHERVADCLMSGGLYSADTS